MITPASSALDRAAEHFGRRGRDAEVRMMNESMNGEKRTAAKLYSAFFILTSAFPLRASPS